MKKFISVLLCLFMLTSLIACGGSEAKNAVPEEDVFRIGICQLVQHQALDAATQGFKDALTEAFGDKVIFDDQNASGDSANCSTIVNGFVSDGVDLIMANATPPLQAAAAATDSIPILGTSVTDYASALDISDWSGTVGGNISGTSDLAPLADQAAMIREVFPDAKNIGLLYCSAEANSVFQITNMESLLKDEGLNVSLFSFTDTNDVASVTEAACEASDVIYIPTDNTAASNAEAIANIVLPAAVPVVCGEENLCAGCGCVTLTIDYYDIGFVTGQMAAQILKGEADISTMAIRSAPQVTKKFQRENCEALNITVPSDYVAIGE